MPYSIAVIHGGPGACGEMAPVARRLASSFGVLEPMQTALSLDGQVDELRAHLESHASRRVTLIGYSWGAWLSYIVAARFPFLIRKLILVSSGPFVESYVANLGATRLSRFTPEEREAYQALSAAFGSADEIKRIQLLAQLGELTAKADSYNPIDDDPLNGVDVRPEQFQHVWPEAAELRRSGALLSLGKQITCPAVAIHGDFDPHPAEGVQKPLSEIVNDFRFILLNRCGHTPWREREAKEQFYEILRMELE